MAILMHVQGIQNDFQRRPKMYPEKPAAVSNDKGEEK